MNIDHIVLWVDNQQHPLAFFVDLLGMERIGSSGPASFGGKGMSRWPFLVRHLSYRPVNPFDSFHTWRERADPTFSNSLDH